MPTRQARRQRKRPRTAARPTCTRGERPSSTLDEAVGVVVADAIRLRKWGREWHELATIIGRMAGRPELTEVRRILRTHKADIEAGNPPQGAPNSR